MTRIDNCHCETYTGVTAGTFKCRWYGHCHDIRHRPNPDDNHQGTTLSKYIWQLKDQTLLYNLEWEMVTKGADYNPATGICGVCSLEKFFIMFKPRGASLNQRSEFFTHCRHYRKFLLCPPGLKSGSWFFLSSIFNFRISPFHQINFCLFNVFCVFSVSHFP